MRATLTSFATVGALVSVSSLMGCGGSETKATRKCAELSCIEHQVCQEASGQSDAECLDECEAGFVWNSPGSCDAVGDVCALLDCVSEGRICVVNTSVVECGDCSLVA